MAGVLTVIVPVHCLNERQNWTKILLLVNNTGEMEFRTRDDYVWLIFPFSRSLSDEAIDTIVSLVQEDENELPILIGPHLQNIYPPAQSL